MNATVVNRSALLEALNHPFDQCRAMMKKARYDRAYRELMRFNYPSIGLGIQITANKHEAHVKTNRLSGKSEKLQYKTRFVIPMSDFLKLKKRFGCLTEGVFIDLLTLDYIDGQKGVSDYLAKLPD